MHKADIVIYQLETGKIIYITVEQFLSLSDDELDSLSSMNIGEYAKSPWVGSVIRDKKKPKADPEDIDTSIDYTEENEETGGEKPSINEEGPESFPDTPEEESNID